MEAVFPITQRNGEPYHTLSDFTKMFDQVKSGRYLLGQGYGWHSGVHLTSKMVPWGKGLRPIQSMLDGKIIAYRIHEDYQKTLYKGQELKFSNNFVLIEHECQNPDDSNDNFKFYSLYMHLAPPADIGANSSPSTRYKMVMEQGKRNVRIFKLDSKPKKESWEDTVGMSAGTILEYLYAEEKETHKYNINGTDYHMIKCRVVEAGDQNATREKGMEGKLVWFAAGKASEFDILENTSVMQPVPVSEPPWMKKDAAKLRNGSVVPLTLSVDGTPDLGISINAGDEIGYMGLHEYSNDINATKKEDNRVHIELFSVDEPPEYFKKLISPTNAEETPLIVIDGSESDGALSSENTFFVSLAKEVSKSRNSSDGAAEEKERDFALWTPKDLQIYLDNKRKHFERVIAKHPSDWHAERSNATYERIHKVAKEMQEEVLSRGFVSLKDYKNSRWRKKVIAEYDVFSKHERERAKEISWLESVESVANKTNNGLVWHYWPFIASNKPFMFTVEMMSKVYPLVKDSKRDLLQAIVNELNDHIEFYKLDTALRRTHFFAQIMQETGRTLNMAEYTNYRISTLDSDVYETARGRNYPSDHAKHPGERYIDVLGIHEKRDGKFVKKDGNRPSLEDKRMLFNVMYGGRKDLGNHDYLTTDDGWNYRGRGLKQLTGRRNYTGFNKWHAKNKSEWPEDKIDLITNPEIILQAKYATRSSAWFWVSNKLYEIADSGANGEAVNKITRKVNSGTDSYALRRSNFSDLWKNGVFE